MGDMNINALSSLDKLEELCDTPGLHNLIKVSTCEMQRSSTSSDLILTDRRFTLNTPMGLKQVE